MAKEKTPKRFVEVYTQKNPGRIRILVDMATGVNYMMFSDDNGFTSVSGMTPLLNADGTPVVTPPEMILPE